MPMANGWKHRLLKAIDDDPRSDRAISMASKLGPNFVNELRNTDKEPGTDKLMKLIAELGVSASEILLDVGITSEDEEFLRLLKNLTEPERALYLAALKARQTPQP
jgi:hypothetical protein